MRYFVFHSDREIAVWATKQQKEIQLCLDYGFEETSPLLYYLYKLLTVWPKEPDKCEHSWEQVDVAVVDCYGQVSRHKTPRCKKCGFIYT